MRGLYLNLVVTVSNQVFRSNHHVATTYIWKIVKTFVYTFTCLCHVCMFYVKYVCRRQQIKQEGQGVELRVLFTRYTSIA